MKNIFKLEPKQKKAFEQMKKYHQKCLDLGIKFYNNYGILGALNQKNFDKPYYTDLTEIQHYKTKYILEDEHINSENEFHLKCNENSDDKHYFILKDLVNE
jgi:hypothetical protein